MGMGFQMRATLAQALRVMHEVMDSGISHHKAACILYTMYKHVSTSINKFQIRLVML